MALALPQWISKNNKIRVRRVDEAKHVLAVGDTGSGKTQLIRQLLGYISDCDDVAVVLDSKREFTSEFYEPRRNDTILDPTDERGAYWCFENEVLDEADAMGVMRAFHPKKPNAGNGEWFDDQAARIDAYIQATWHLSCEAFGYILAHPEIIDRLVAGTEHQQTLTENAANQRAGILGTMNSVGFAFRMMPPEADMRTRKNFTIREWADAREGWLFLPNTADTRDALQPLMTGWCDMAISRIMSSRATHRRVWIVLDELDSIGKLSKLHDGMTMMRSSGNPMVLGMQNPVQLEDRYGRQAETIFSQAFTKFIMAVSNDKSAKSLENTIGRIEASTFRSTRTTGIVGGHERDSYSGPEEVMKPLIMAEEIMGLPDLAGYFLQRPTTRTVGTNVVPFRMEYAQPVFRHEPLVKRLIPPIDRRLPAGLEAIHRDMLAEEPVKPVVPAASNSAIITLS